MDLRKNIMMIVSVMVAVIIALAVLVPVIQDSSASEDTLTNTGYYRMSKYDTSVDLSIAWDHTAPYQLTVNDTVVELPSTDTTYDLTVLSDGENLIVRYRAFSDGSAHIQLLATSINGSYPASTKNSTDMTITATNGTIVFDNGSGTTETLTYTNMWCVDNNGNYTMKPSNTTAYVKDDSEIIAIGLSNNFNKYYRVFVDGTMADGFTRTIYPTTTFEGYTLSDVEMVYTDANNYVGLYNFSRLTWSITDGDDTTENVVYSQVIVPYQVTAERSVHVSTIEVSLLGIIPLLVVIGIVIGAVWFIRQKN